MPAYAFDKVLGLTADNFDMEFKSMRDLYVKENGDPIVYLRELAEETVRTNPQKLLAGSGGTKRLLPGRLYMFKYNPKYEDYLANINIPEPQSLYHQP